MIHWFAFPPLWGVLGYLARLGDEWFHRITKQEDSDGMH